jgi:peptidoglycan hydrolase-like protein with peptidoglycan-binding domain
MRAIAAIFATLITACAAVTVNAAPAQAAWPTCFDFATHAWIPANSGVVASWHLPSVVRETRPDGFRGENVNCRLGFGDRGAGVFVLQGALRDCLGHTSLAADGIYGTRTRNAIIWEQARNGFQDSDIDGVYGPKTRAVLRFPLLINGAFSRDCRQG